MTEYIEKYTNGNIKYKETYIRENVTTKEWWYDDGKKLGECQEINGIIHGSHKTWFTNGKLDTEINFKDGKRHGLFASFYYNGDPYHICSYHEGEYHGNYKHWNGYGRLVVNIDYVMGCDKDKALIILKYLRKAKLYRFARLVKTKPFIEWWYSPTGPGGRLHKQSMKTFCESLIKMRSSEPTN